jgi:hypothetical protein
MAAPVSFEYHQNAQTTFQPPLIANENAFLGDVFTSEKNDAQAPISAGFYRLEKGEFGKSKRLHLMYFSSRSMGFGRFLDGRLLASATTSY